MEALADPIRFMGYAMSQATYGDMKIIRRCVFDDDFREALDHKPGLAAPRAGLRNFGAVSGCFRRAIKQSQPAGWVECSETHHRPSSTYEDAMCASSRPSPAASRHNQGPSNNHSLILY
jgi:hypothetical protein